MANTGQIVESFENLFNLKREQPSLEHLGIVTGKFSLIPYENLTKIVRVASIDAPEERLRMPGDVLLDFNRFGAGGTCFSLTYCLESILKHYGYDCAPRMADLGRITNNHCALVTTFESTEYLVDPGYLITQPLPIPALGHVIHPTRLHPVRLEREPLSRSLSLATLEPDGAKHRYNMRDENCSSEDFFHYWQDSFNWNMMHSLLVTRVIEKGRFYLHDRHVRWFNQDGKKTAKVKESYDETVSEYTGISADLVARARLLLSQSKKSLR